MSFDFIDLGLLLIIAGIVGVYIYVRYREERKKKEENLIPNLQFYKKKLHQEKEYFSQKAEKFKEKIKKYRDDLEYIKSHIHQYSWNDDEKKILKSLKRTEFEWVFSFLFRILGFHISEPPVYKDKNIDFIVTTGQNQKICIDFIDRVSIKKLKKKYLDDLIQGKEKYDCDGIWIITNGVLDENFKNSLYTKGINIFDYKDIVKYFPSIRIVEDYYETQTKLHNYQILYKETVDEIIRRKTWIKEVEEKLEEAIKRQMVER